MTTLGHNAIHEIAPHVPALAREGKHFANPYVSLVKLEETCKGNEILEERLQDFVLHALRYAETVCRFEQIVAKRTESTQDGSLAEIETIRTRTHDATISSIDILARSLKKSSKVTEWYAMLAGSRAAYGKFALLIAFEIVMRPQPQA